MKKILLMGMILMIGLASAQFTMVQEAEGDSLILRFEMDEAEIYGYSFVYEFDETEIEVIDVVVEDFGGFIISPYLSQAFKNPTNVSGFVGEYQLRRLTNNSITMTPLGDNVVIVYSNGTKTYFYDEVIIPAVEVEVEDEIEDEVEEEEVDEEEEEIINGTPKLTYTKQYSEENVTITFSLEDNPYEVYGYALTYAFDSNKLSPFNPEIPSGSIFESLNPMNIITTPESIGRDEVSIASVLSDIEDSQAVNGTLGVMKFKRLTNETTTLLPIEVNVGITLKNGTFIDLSEEINIDGYVQEVEEEIEEEEETSTPIPTPTPPTSSGGGSSSSSSSKKSSISSVQTLTATQTQLKQGFVNTLRQSDEVKFTLSSPHTMRVTEIKDKKVTLLIQSDPIFLTLGEYESKIVELDSECLKVYVGQITDKAVVHIQSAECQAKEVEEKEEVIEVNGRGELEVKDVPMLPVYGAIFLLIVLILFRIIYNALREKKEDKEEYRDFLEVEEKS
jgi:hypothetical protein